MLWKIRARVGDRPGTLARLAARCGEHGLNILGLQIFPAPDGVVDELVLSTPTQWEDADVVELVRAAGGVEVSASRCSLRALQDPVVRYLQAVTSAHEGRMSLAAALEELLETGLPDVAEYVGHDELAVPAPGGSDAVIRRAVRFTPTERARAEALADVLGRLDPTAQLPTARHRTPEVEPAYDLRSILVRTATLDDVDALAALHGRCSRRTLAKCYHEDAAQHLDFLELARGQVQAELPCLVAAVDNRVVGLVTREPGTRAGTVRCGVLVEDAWQQRGVGVALLTAAARASAATGAHELVLFARPGNDVVLRTVGRCGLTARLRRVGGKLSITVPLGALASSAQPRRADTLV